MPVTITRPRHSAKIRTPFQALVDAVDEREDRGRFHLKDSSRESQIDVVTRLMRRSRGRRLARGASIRFSFMMSASSRSSARVGGIALRLGGSSWISMKTTSTPAATPAAASGSICCARPAVTPSRRLAAQAV